MTLDGNAAVPARFGGVGACDSIAARGAHVCVARGSQGGVGRCSGQSRRRSPVVSCADANRDELLHKSELGTS